MARLLVVALVLLCCVVYSWQRCFSYNCEHEATLAECAQGDWTCEDDQYCRIATHQDHGNNRWVTTDCMAASEKDQCETDAANNDAACDPLNHEIECIWCCDDEACVRALAGMPPLNSTA